jgi:hypothetical protein
MESESGLGGRWLPYGLLPELQQFVSVVGDRINRVTLAD